MCEGLPCRGAYVRLVRDVKLLATMLPAGSIGVIREELLRERKVVVYFDEQDLEGPVAETDLEEVETEGLPS